MRTKIKWAELRAPLFLSGSNLGMKLDKGTKGGVTMEYDEERRHLYVTHQGKTARVPEPSILSMVEMDNVVEMPKAQPAGTNAAITAQVETPQSHVHAGAGAGQTGQEPIKRGPGRPAKQ